MGMRYTIPVLFILVTMLVISGSVAPGSKVLHRSFDEYNFLTGVIPEDAEVVFDTPVPEKRVPKLLLLTVDYGMRDANRLARRLGMDDPELRKEDLYVEASEGEQKLEVYRYVPHFSYWNEGVSYFDGPFRDEDYYVRIAADYLAIVIDFYPWLTQYDIDVKVHFGVAHLVGAEGERVGGVSVSFNLRWGGMTIEPGVIVTLTNNGELARMYVTAWDFVVSGYLMLDRTMLESIPGSYFIPAEGNGFSILEGSGIEKMVVKKISVVQDTHLPTREVSDYDSVYAFPFVRLQGEAWLKNGKNAYMDILIPLVYEL